MGVGEKTDLRELLRVLDNHVQSHYSSYKSAFLQLDAVCIKWLIVYIKPVQSDNSLKWVKGKAIVSTDWNIFMR